LLSSSHIKLATPGSLDAKPLVFGLETGVAKHEVELVRDIPSRCALKLRNGEVRAGLVPCIEYAKHYVEQSYQIIPAIAISSCGAVGSARLYFNEGLQNINTVAVDIGSITEIVLARILLSERYNVEPRFLPMNPDVKAMLSKADAALVIGDEAFFDDSGWTSKIDVGEEWQDFSELPFVYSFWVGRQNLLQEKEVGWLLQSKEFGVQKISDIAGDAARTHNVDLALCEHYLTQSLHYDLGENELDGLREFYRLCFYYGMIDDIPDLNFFGL
jgi:predicted solute-binding protein